MKNEKRCLELSKKFLQMGEALMAEGTQSDDYTIAQSGTIMILLSSLMTSDRDMFIFSELSSMFVAKKILDERENINPVESEIFAKILSDIKAEKEKKNTPPKKRRGGKKPDTDKPEGQ